VKCPFCGTPETKVVDSRLNQTGDVTRRRRECGQCDSRFTTYEHVEELLPAVIKKDGRREPFDRMKLLGGIKKALQKRSVPSEKIDEMVSRVEKSVQRLGLKEIPARSIGERVMSELHAVDLVAYIRFASVYREFRDVEEFVAELELQDAQRAQPSQAEPPRASLS
jgi:transcriptional repressor NrdR